MIIGSPGVTPRRSSGIVARDTIISPTMRRHWVFLMLLAVGTVLRFLVWMAYKPALLLQADTYTYLSQALHPTPQGSRPAVYPLILKGLLVFDRLWVVTAVQHLIGVGLAVLLYLLLRRLTVAPAVAALGTAPLLLDGYQLNIEQYVLTETFFEAMIISAFALLAWQAKPSFWAVGGAGVLLALSGLTRFAGLSLIPVALLYALWRRFGWIRVASLGVAIALPILGYSLWFQAEGEKAGLTNKNGYFLYGRVASFADCRIKVPEGLGEYCFDTAPENRPVSQGHYTLEFPESKDPTETNARLYRFSTEMIKAQPMAYAGAVGTDFVRYFEFAAPIKREHYVARWRFVQSVEEAIPIPRILKLGGQPPRAVDSPEEFRIDQPLANKLRTYQDYVYMYGPLLAFALLLGIAGIVVPAGGDTRLRSASALFTLGALALLLLPVMATVFHFRYVMPAIPLAGVAGSIGATAIWRWLQRRQAGDGSPASEDGEGRGGPGPSGEPS
jgi:hypothetical protein